MDKQLTFEQALTKLQEVSESMEDEKTSFKEGLALYEQAAELLIYCKKMLSEGEGKVEEINAKLEKSEIKLK